MRRRVQRGLGGLLAVLLVGALASTATASRDSVEGEGAGLEPVAHIPWKSGSDMEVATIKGRDYAFAGSRGSIIDGGGLHVIDVTNPEQPKEVAWLKCQVNQNDIQISHDQKTLIMAADSRGGPDSCLMATRIGFMTVDITNPKNPKPIGYAEIPRGSHNTTAHPTKPYVYNSDADLERQGEIQIWSIKDPAKPKLVNTVPSLPHSPHDIGFNEDGTMAVTAAISHFDLFDTSDPENPTLLYTGQCPGCSITHDAKFTPDGKGLVIGDEGGGGLPYPCPGGALYFYKLQADRVPVLTGIYEPDEVVTAQGGAGACTSHVFEISDDGSKLAIAWYTSGVRYLDIGDLTGAAVGPYSAGNIKQLGWYIPKGGNTWSAKLHKGPYIFTNDINLGFIVYKVTAE